MTRSNYTIALDASREVGNNGIVQEIGMKSSSYRTVNRPDGAQSNVKLQASLASNRVSSQYRRVNKIMSFILVYYLTISLFQNGAILNVGPAGLNIGVQASNHHHSRHIRSSGDDFDDSSQPNQQQGSSWSHWWSYDGISGPDYWNINKHWRLCTLGRKQSPVNVRTDRLVYDHLLGPIQLTWRRNHQQEQHTKHTGLLVNQLDSQPADKHSIEANANFANKTEQQKSVQLRLVNSGRGIEAWLEGGEGVVLKEQQQNEHLYLARGPLSYEYKLYKIELHSAATQADSGGGAAFLSSNSLENLSSPNGGINQHQSSKEAPRGVASLSHPAAYSMTTSSAGGGGSAASNTNNLNKIGDRIIATNGGDDDNDNDVGNGGNVASQANPGGQDGDGDGDEIVPEAVRVAPKTSEHLIDGRPFVGEVQLHFYNKQLAASAQEALRLANEQPLASLFSVISVFISLKKQAVGPIRDSSGDTSSARSTESSFEAGATTPEPGVRAESRGEHYDQLGVEMKTTTTTKSGPSSPLAFILDNLHQVENQADSIELRVARSQIDALVTDKRNYVTYQGSMNRPPCAENVDWILLNRALQVDPGKFGQLFDKPSTNQDNIRPVRQLNGRLLRTTISLGGHAAAAIDRHQLGITAAGATGSIRSQLGGEQVNSCGQGGAKVPRSVRCPLAPIGLANCRRSCNCKQECNRDTQGRVHSSGASSSRRKQGRHKHHQLDS